MLRSLALNELLHSLTRGLRGSIPGLRPRDFVSPLAGPGGLNALPAGIAKALESTRGENSGWRPPPQPGLHSGTAPWGPSFGG